MERIPRRLPVRLLAVCAAFTLASCGASGADDTQAELSMQTNLATITDPGSGETREAWCIDDVELNVTLTGGEVGDGQTTLHEPAICEDRRIDLEEAKEVFGTLIATAETP